MPFIAKFVSCKQESIACNIDSLIASQCSILSIGICLTKSNWPEKATVIYAFQLCSNSAHIIAALTESDKNKKNNEVNPKIEVNTKKSEIESDKHVCAYDMK